MYPMYYVYQILFILYLHIYHTFLPVIVMIGIHIISLILKFIYKLNIILLSL